MLLFNIQNISLKSPGLTWTLELISGALEFFYPSRAEDILHSNKVFSLKQTQSSFVTSYQVKIVLDVLNLLTGVIIFVVLVVKVSFLRDIREPIKYCLAHFSAKGVPKSTNLTPHCVFRKVFGRS